MGKERKGKEKPNDTPTFRKNTSIVRLRKIRTTGCPSEEQNVVDCIGIVRDQNTVCHNWSTKLHFFAEANEFLYRKAN